MHAVMEKAGSRHSDWLNQLGLYYLLIRHIQLADPILTFATI